MSWTRRMSKLPVKLQFRDAFFKSLTRTHLKGLHMIRKQWFLFGAKICRNVCARTLSVSRCEQFSESEAQGNLWGSRIDNIQIQTQEPIFVQNVNEQLSVCFVGWFLLSVVWYYFMKKQIFRSSVTIIKKLSHLWLNFKRRIFVVDVSFEKGYITSVIWHKGYITSVIWHWHYIGKCASQNLSSNSISLNYYF